MARFIQKPVVVEGWEVTRLVIANRRNRLPVEVAQAKARGTMTFGADYIDVSTTVGTRRAVYGEWVIQNVDGAFDVYTQTSLNAAYESF